MELFVKVMLKIAQNYNKCNYSITSYHIIFFKVGVT